MLYDVEGNLILEKRYNIICHQTNCHGAMVTKIGRQIAAAYPAVVARDKDYCRLRNALGTILPVRIQPDKVCINIYGQYDYGRHEQFTDYGALKNALQMLVKWLNEKNIRYDWTIAFPYRMGCGLAGGSWALVRPLIEDFSKRVMQDVYIVHLPEREKT